MFYIQLNAPGPFAQVFAHYDLMCLLPENERILRLVGFSTLMAVPNDKKVIASLTLNNGFM